MPEENEKKVLTSNIKRFLKSALLLYQDADFTSATILYFKALFSILDLTLLQKQGKIPKDHTERFHLLKSSYPDFYTTLDKLFPIYRDTYTASISKETSITVKENVERIAQKQGILEEN